MVPRFAGVWVAWFGVLALSGCFGPQPLAPGHALGDVDGPCGNECWVLAVRAAAVVSSTWDEGAFRGAFESLHFQEANGSGRPVPLEDVTLVRPSDGVVVGFTEVHGRTSMRFAIPEEEKVGPFDGGEAERWVKASAPAWIPAFDELMREVSPTVTLDERIDVIWGATLRWESLRGV